MATTKLPSASNLLSGRARRRPLRFIPHAVHRNEGMPNPTSPTKQPGELSDRERAKARRAFKAALNAAEVEECIRIVTSPEHGGDGERARQAAYEAANGLHRPFFSACSGMKRIESALRYAKAFPSECRPKLFSMLIAELGNRGLYEEAAEAYRNHIEPTEDGSEASMHLCSGLVSAAGKAGKLSKAREEFRLAVGKHPRAIAIYNAFLDACIRCGAFSDISSVAEEMEREGPKPDLKTFNTLIKAAAKKGDMEEALELERRLRYRGFFPNERTHGSLLSCAAEARDADSAITIYERMLASERFTPNNHVVSALLVALGRGSSSSLGQGETVKYALTATRKLKANGDGLNEKVLSALASLGSALGKPEVAWLAIREERKKLGTVGPFTLSAGVSAGAEKATPRVARALIAEYRGAPHGSKNVAARNAAIKLLMRAGWEDEAEAELEEMERRGPEPTLLSYQAVMDLSQSSAGALKAFRRMRERGIQPDEHTYASLMATIGRRRSSLAASQTEGVFRRMRAAGISPGTEAYAALLGAKAKSGSRHHVKQCFAIFREMCEEGVSPTIQCYERLLEACEALADGRAAKAVRKAMADTGVAPTDRAYNLLVRTLCASGDLEEMLHRLSEAARNSNIHAGTLEFAVRAFVRLHYAERAARVIRLAEIMGIALSSESFSLAVWAASREGLVLEARSLAQRAWEQGHHLSSPAASWLVCSLCQAGETDEAVRAAGPAEEDLSERACLSLVLACARHPGLTFFNTGVTLLERYKARHGFAKLATRPLLELAANALDAIIEASIRCNRLDVALQAFDDAKANPRVELGQQALAYLHNACARADVEWYRRLDVASVMRRQQEAFRASRRPLPRKKCHHFGPGRGSGSET